MKEALKESYERCCRLCAEEQDVTIMIFSQEAEDMLLLNKLNEYLLIEVDEDDKLPKNICIQCCTKLQTVCEFIDTARKAQDLLLKRSLILDDLLSQKCEISSIKCEVKSEPEDEPDDDSKYTAIEVSVDPMMVLQNSQELLSPNNNENVTVEDVTYLHGVDAENVTIKLIKKCEKVLEENLTNNDDDDNDEEEDEDKKPDKPKPFPCLTCKRSFCTDIALKNHTWQHIGANTPYEKYTCSTCKETFQYKNALIAHLKIHNENGLCQLCGRMFRSQKNYIAHMAVHSPTNKSYTCKICGRSYNTWGNLRTHSIAHSSEKPYQCHICKKTFKRNQDLKFHINQHTGARPYKCPFCDKCFASSGNCYSHRSRMHPGRFVESKIRRYNTSVKKDKSPPSKSSPRPIAPKGSLTVVKGVFKYLCSLCNASFVKKDNFTYHMYQHTGEKPFQCSFCPEQFVTRGGLLLHHDKEHPGKNRPLALLSKNILLK
ncbi:unnamed protein product [Arctia plantaginis]|uniref:Uncharacterized protein n=1 Tax=Arctia plantaginis TaxID=874455 RepID=A0A8S1A879_ARCPL|nr:unnamed protein product [Arctia plantaginis]